MTEPSTNPGVPPVEQFQGAGSLLIWDRDTPLPAWDGPVILWRSFRRTRVESVFSLPEVVDERAEELRRRFLAFVHQVGETRINGQSIIDRLELRPGLSYWWMTLIAQKDVYASSPQIYDVIKLFAFEDLARSYDRSPVRLVSRNRELSLVLRAWCQDEGRHFEWIKPDGRNTNRSLSGSIYKRFPSIVRALFTFLKFVSLRAPLLGEREAIKRLSQSDVAVFDAFTHLDPRSMAAGTFDSGYWSNLVTFFNESKVSVNWFHWYYGHPLVPDLHTATLLASRFTNPSERQYHQIIDGRFSVRLAAKVVMDFIRLNRAGLSMKGVKQSFRPENSRLNFWQLFKRDWGESLFGPKVVVSLFHLNILEEQLKDTPHQKLGIYIQENQPWELALVHLWKTFGHGHLVGAPHTTVPFWDLRYAFDPQTFEVKKNCLPIPDVIALNGPNAISRFEELNYPTGCYREVEALRYLYLGNLRHSIAREVSKNSRALRLLVLGDLLPAYTETQISFLESCFRTSEIKLDVVFKPHPAAARFFRNIELPNLRISTRHISEELSECDAVFVGSATSAAADAYQVGVPVISVNDGNRINFSPLYKTQGVEFVNSPDDLATALSYVDINRKTQHGAFFIIDETIPRWKSLILDALNAK